MPPAFILGHIVRSAGRCGGRTPSSRCYWLEAYTRPDATTPRVISLPTTCSTRGPDERPARSRWREDCSWHRGPSRGHYPRIRGEILEQDVDRPDGRGVDGAGGREVQLLLQRSNYGGRAGTENALL